MSKQKQIEEMAKAILRANDNYDTTCREDCMTIADMIYEAGYRKQSEGEWVKAYRRGLTVNDGYVSTCCDMWNNRKSHFCPNCGAKMKGGEEE